MPSNFFVILISSTSAETYAFFVSPGTGLSRVIIKRVPIAMPHAPHARDAAKPDPSLNPPAATTGISTCSRTELSNKVVGVDPV